MTLRVSTKFKELILGPTAFETVFNGGRILVYSGSQPANADFAATGTLLGQITNEGQAWTAGGSAGGIEFARSGAWVTQAAAQSWRLVVTASGTAGWFRLVGKNADSGGASYAAPRIDGAIGTNGATELTLESTTLTAGQNIAVQQFLYTLPPLGA